MADFVKLEKEEKPQKKKSWFSFKTFILLVIAFFVLSSLLSALSFSMSSKVAVVPIKGAIMTESSSSFYSSSISSRAISQTLYSLADDTTVKAIILDINSPGGSPVGSEEISEAIEYVKSQNKTIYALINDMGVSGAFWVAVSTDKIYASKMSTLGSIGVTSAGLSFENFIKEYNITYRKQTAGDLKDMGSIYREPTQREEELLQQALDEIHYKFIAHVATQRNLSYDYVKNYSTGEIFLGSKAKELGFIDEFGTYKQVLDELDSQLQEEVLVVTYGEQETLLDIIGFSGIFAQTPQSVVLLQ